MTEPVELPADVTIDAWTGSETASGAVADRADRWGARGGVPGSQQFLEFGAPGDLKDWASEDVGYGVLLPLESEIPAPIRDLLAQRPKTVVLRWHPDFGDRYLKRQKADGQLQDANISGSPIGTGDGALPRYILIAAPPSEIPWSLQYTLSVGFFVGRLPFSGDALGPYVRAMLTKWSAGTPNLSKALVWATDYGPTDITRLMAAAIAAPLSQELNGTVAVNSVIGPDASGARLLSELGAEPGLVVTSSHGSTPVDDPALLAATLGLPVAQNRQVVSLDGLDAAMPGGAVWFAQACCSAGSSGTSFYEGLLQPDTSAGRVLKQVAAMGTTIAPAALRLLGRENPVRAVLGHVEPTFDWTLRDENTKQLFGGTLVKALSANLFSGQPVGLAFDQYRRQIGLLNTTYHSVHNKLAGGDTSVRATLTRLRLTALDRQALVLLGDPTVALPSIFG